ncbi:MAG: beta-galactosidase [Phycisphaerae bacterium]|nr:beta-galactosidase [Phycisphaerae bacterium]
MGLTACVRPHNGRPVLWINGEPTTEMWAYGAPNAVADFAAAGIRICQCHVPGKSWWTGPGQYRFAHIEAQIEEFLKAVPSALLMPRVCFGYEGEGWWADAHPDDLAVGREPGGRVVPYPEVRAHPVECWYSAASQTWTRDACEAMAAFVRHFEAGYGDHILGYQIGAGISCEWFRWWNYVEGIYEDYSPVARQAFRGFLKARYRTEAALREAWGRDDVTFDTAEVPHPGRLHQPQNGFLRSLPGERDIVDWFDALSEWNADQLMALCHAVKEASGGRKLAGGFYAYTWPHWNNQSAARGGHMAISRVLACPDVDYVSSPYHYDNRNLCGVHASQSLPQTIERGGKLHLDEIDTGTHRVKGEHWPWDHQGPPDTLAESRILLRRDAAAVLGTAGNAWWMDLHHSGWYHDPQLQLELRETNALARAALADSPAPGAEVALVLDDRSPAYVDTRSNLNQYFTALSRQFEWSRMGLPVDEMLLSEIDRVRPYRLYVFLNCWNVGPELRRRVRERVSRIGATTVWIHAAGYFDGHHGSAENVADLTGIRVREEADAAVPDIDVLESGHGWLAPGPDRPSGSVRFGARLTPDQIRVMVGADQRCWDTPMSPVFTVDDPDATVLGRYAHNGRPGLAVVERDGRRSVYCGAPMLPAWLLRRMAVSAGAHAYAPLGTVVHHRGSLVSVYAPAGGEPVITAPPGASLTLIEPAGGECEWRPAGAPGRRLTLPFSEGQTRFFRLTAIDPCEEVAP